MAQPPATPRTIGRKVNDYLAANEQLQALKSDLRQMLFEDEVPLRSAARRQPSDSDDGNDGGEASSSGLGSEKVRFDPSAKPKKGILKNATPKLVASVAPTDKEDTNGGNDTTLEVTDESDTESEPELSEFEQQLRQYLIKGHRALWWQVIKQVHEMMVLECQKKVKGKDEYAFVCPRPECGLQSKKWGVLFDHYLTAHFDSHEWEDVKPLACPETECSEAFSCLIDFFSHVVKGHPGSGAREALFIIYQEHDILPSE